MNIKMICFGAMTLSMVAGSARLSCCRAAVTRGSSSSRLTASDGAEIPLGAARTVPATNPQTVTSVTISIQTIGFLNPRAGGVVTRV